MAEETTDKRGILLEVGFGGGQAFEEAHTSGRWERVVGFEIASDFVVFAKERGLEAYYIDVTTCPPMEGLAGQCDLIFCSEVMEHIEDPVGFVKGMLKYTKPDGRLWLSFATEVERKQLAWGEWQYWTMESILRLAELCGVKNIDISPPRPEALFVTMGPFE